MIPSKCHSCDRYVLSLVGQFELLDSYFLEPGGPPPESAGEWHTTCLRKSAVGGAWAAARRRNFGEVRGYEAVARIEGWSVSADPRDGARLAFSDMGQMLELPRARDLVPVADGATYRERRGMYNLHLPEPKLISAMKELLERDASCPMQMLFEELGLIPYLDHVEVLANARFVYDEELREDWGAQSFCAVAEYNVFVPAELVPHCG